MIPHADWLSTISAHLPAYYALAAGNARPCTCERVWLTHNARAFVSSYPSLSRHFPFRRFLILWFSVSSAHSLILSDLCVTDISDLFVTIDIRGRRKFQSFQLLVNSNVRPRFTLTRCGLQQRNSTNAITTSWDRIFRSDYDEGCKSVLKVKSTDS